MRSRFSSIAAVMRLGGVGALVVAGTIVLSGGTAMAAPHSAAAYTCGGGALNLADLPSSTFVDIPSNTYSSITVTGVCDVPDNAVITVLGNINLAPGAVLDAQGAPSTITVGHNFIAASGSILALGCLPNPLGHTTGHPCGTSLVGNTLSNIDPLTAISHITVDGNVIATGANTVWLNGITVNGNVVLTGGGGPYPIPWPIKDNTIRGNLIVSAMTPNWLGVMHNDIGGNAILTNVNITDGLEGDPNPTIFVASNEVGQNLICTGLGPAVSGGFTGEVNVVGHKAIGQCANLTTVSPDS